MNSMFTDELEYCSALHWSGLDDCWYRYEDGVWRGWRVASASCTIRAAGGLSADWRPWSQVLDTSRHPYMSWFKGARTNISFSALDVHCLEGNSNDVSLKST